MEKKNIHIPYAVITAIVMIIIGLINYFTGWAFKPGMQYLSMLPMLIGLILNANAFAKANDYRVTYGNVYGSCFRAVLVMALVLVGWGIIQLIAMPEMKERTLARMQEEMMKNKQLSDDMIEKSLSFSRKGYTTIVVAGALFGTVLSGAILSLIAAAIPRKRGNNPFEGDNF